MTGVGQSILDRLEKAQLSQLDLSDIIERPTKSVNAIINNQKEVTPQTAVELYHAIGGHPLYWMLLDVFRKMEHAGYGEYSWDSSICDALLELSKKRSW